MVCMRMCDEQRIEPRQCVDGNPRSADTRKDPAQIRRKVRIGENARSAQLDEQRRMPDVRNP
jgi:hypothetical protein